jgi:hypothetical protein
MPGWDSLQAVSWMHGAVQLLGLLLIALLAAAAAAAYSYLARAPRPETIDISGFPLRTRWLETSAALAVALLIVAEVAAYGFGHRKDALLASAERTRVDQTRGEIASLQRQGKQVAELQRRNRELEARRAAEQAGAAAEIARLERTLSDAEGRFVELQRARGQRRLSNDEKQTLIAALKPFTGQKVTVASIRGDDEAKDLAEDFVGVFDAAGWDHNGETGVSAQQWDRDPVGIEVTLNEADARAGRISAGVGALINVVRKLGLTQDNTIYMNSEVPSGQAQLRVGKKLKK